jgi:CheY-like chemotaxis protein
MQRAEKKPVVLYADDDEFVGAIVADMLEAEGFECVIARGGVEAMKLIDQSSEPYDVLLSDVRMPGVNGLELARHFREVCPHQPVLLLSGYPIPTEEGDRFAILKKPMGGEQLACAIWQMLEQTTA